MTKSTFRVLSLATVLAALLSCQLCVGKKNYGLPHAHQGVLNSYEPGPFSSLDLTSGDEKELEAGKPVMKQQQGADLAGTAICVQDVEAPKAAVWSQILDLDAYKGKVPKVNECKNYEVQQNSDGTTTMKTKMVVGVIPGYAVSVLFTRFTVLLQPKLVLTILSTDDYHATFPQVHILLRPHVPP